MSTVASVKKPAKPAPKPAAAAEFVAVIKPGDKKTKKFLDPKTELKQNPAAIDLEERKKAMWGDTANQYANDFFCYRNEPVKELIAAFPYDKDMQCCDRFYPHAPQGKLFVDVPQNDQEIKKCDQKAHVMFEAGHRYCYVKPAESLEGLLARLEKDELVLKRRAK